MKEDQDLTSGAIVWIDGQCNLCNKAVQFIVKRDPQGYFRFAAQQSSLGQKWKTYIEQDLASKGAQLHWLDQVSESQPSDDQNPPPHSAIVLLEQGRAYTGSTAALRIARKLTGFWRLLYGFIWIPRIIRDPIYYWIARNRYRWFGHQQACMLPSPALKQRFID